MADDVTLPGTGSKVASDDDGTRQYQWVKLVWGPDDTFNKIDVASGKPLPIQARHSDGTILSDATGLKISTAQLAALATTAQAMSAGFQLVDVPTDGTTGVRFGALTETAPASDTASSGLNGRLQRVAQRLTSLIALVPTSLGAKSAANSFATTTATDDNTLALYGAVTETAPASDTASSGLNGRLQRIAQRLSTLIGSTLITGGDIAHDAADSGSPVKQGFKATSSLSGRTPVADGDRTDGFGGVDGVQIVRPHCNLEDLVSGILPNTDGASTSVIAAQGAGIKIYITSVIIANTSATAVTVDLRDGAAGSVKATFPVPANTSGVVCNLPVPLGFTANTAVCMDGSAAASTVTCTLLGFKSKV